MYEQNPIEADIVIGVPDSGVPAAIGYAEASGIPYSAALLKNKYVGRTFIAPVQELRERAVRVKLNPIKELIKDNIASETKISIYEGEWPDMRAIPGSDIPLPVELFVAAPMIKDWREGRVSESKGGKSSRDIITQKWIRKLVLQYAV